MIVSLRSSRTGHLPHEEERRSLSKKKLSYSGVKNTLTKTKIKDKHQEINTHNQNETQYRTAKKNS